VRKALINTETGECVEILRQSSQLDLRELSRVGVLEDLDGAAIPAGIQGSWSEGEEGQQHRAFSHQVSSLTVNDMPAVAAAAGLEVRCVATAPTRCIHAGWAGWGFLEAAATQSCYDAQSLAKKL